MFRKTNLIVLLVIAFLMLACSITANAPSTGADETQVALQAQLTVQAAQQSTMSAQLTQQAGQPPVLPDTPAPAATPQPTATPDLLQQMADANILVYEDTLYIGLWIKTALDDLGLPYTHVNNSIGIFMENLNSGIQWDLIIVGGEAKGGVQGEFWDVISDHVNGDNKTALIAEIWYLDLYGEGRIKPLLAQCGVSFQRDWDLADSIYWLAPEDPVFNDPNTVLPLLHYNRYWYAEAGDLVQLTSPSDATLLAGILPNVNTSYGLITSCFDGRVIFQTFSNHDFPRDEIIALWQNYITNTLANHFAIKP